MAIRIPIITPNKTVFNKYGVKSPLNIVKVNIKNTILTKTEIIIYQYNFKIKSILSSI